MTEQLDYIFFIYGFTFVVMAVTCFFAEKKQGSLPWTWLGFFCLFHGLNEWLDMLAMSLGDSLSLKIARVCFIALASICLLGGINSTYVIFRAKRQSDNFKERNNLFVLVVLFAIYVVVCAIILPEISFLPSSMLFLQMSGLPMQLLRGMLAVASALCIWQALGSHRIRKTYRTVFVCSLLMIIVGGWFFTNRIGNIEYQGWVNNLKSTCIISAASINSEVVRGIDSIEDIRSPHYRLLKDRLMRMQQTSPDFRYIYLMVVRNGRIIFSADSEPVTSKDYSPPGDEYTDAPAKLRSLCRGERENTIVMYEDKWGKWVSAFAPIKDDVVGKPVAVLGIDYLQTKIYHAISTKRLHAIVLTFLVAVITSLLFYYRERRELSIESISEARDSLQEKEEHLSCTLQSIGDAVIVTDCDARVTRMNRIAEILTGWTAIDAIGRPVKEVFHIINSTTREPAFNPITQVLETGNNAELANGTIIVSKNGTECQIADSCSPVHDNQGNVIGVVLVFRDVTEDYRQRKQLCESEARFDQLAEQSRTITWEVDANGLFTYISHVVEQIVGYRPDEMVGQMHYDELLTEDDCKSFKKYTSAAVVNNESFQNWEHTIHTKDRNFVWVSTNIIPIFNADGTFQGYRGSNTDITERKEAVIALQNEKNNLAAIFASSPIGMLLLDEETMIIEANDVIAGMVSRMPENIINQRGGGGLGCIHSFENERGCGFGSACSNCSLRQGVMQVLNDGMSIHGAEIQFTLLVKEQECHPWLRISAEPVTINDRRHVVVAIDDVTERKEYEEKLALAKAEAETLNRQLEFALLDSNEYAVSLENAKGEIENNAIKLAYQATHDALTNLPNRKYFEQHLDELIAANPNRKSASMAVLFLDLDKFKLINDTLGHKVGDLLLIEVTQRLQSCLRSEDVLARMGGDEFTVIIPHSQCRTAIESVASRMIDCVSRSFEIQGHKFVIGASIGLASYPSDGQDTVSLLKHADAAMYKAKQSGRGKFCWYSGDVDVENQQRAEMEMDIRTALEEGQFNVYYQPIVNLDDGNILAAEALLRWEHPEKGMISPSLFIPIAEEIGLIGPIGDFVLRKACAQTMAWRDEGIQLSQIGVNVSTVQVCNANWFDTVRAAILDTGLDARCLNLELTENDFAADYESMKETLHKVRELGICMAIDDFGIGQSSLSRLKDFPVIHLKIDGSFVRDIEHKKIDNNLLRSIIEMAHGQGIKVTAEWVETESQMERLRSMNCDYAQGYFISPALPAEAFANFAKQWTSTQQSADAA